MDKSIKTGLVLEGGAMRGMFTCGILDVLMDNDIHFDGAIGVSAGAVFGCNIKSGQKGRAIRYNKNYCQDDRYVSFKNLLRTGNLYGVDFCYNQIPYVLDKWNEKAYRNNPMEFYVVATNVETGKPVYHKCMNGDYEDIRWYRASASMPLVSKIVEIEGKKLLDGGVGDSIPLKYMEQKGYNKNVVILTREAEYRKSKPSYMPLAHVVLRKYPNMLKAMSDRHIRYNKEVEYINEQEKAGNTFVIRPPYPLNIGGMEKDPNELERVYRIGVDTAQKCLESLKDFINREV